MNTKTKIIAKSALVASLAAATFLGVSACSSSSSSDGSNPTVSASFDGGSVNTGSLPANWPKDVPTPQGLDYQGGAEISGNFNASWKGSGNVATITSALNSQFQANGWTTENNFGGGDSGGVYTYKKGDYTVQLTIAKQDDSTVVVNIGVVKTAGSSPSQ